MNIKLLPAIRQVDTLETGRGDASHCRDSEPTRDLSTGEMFDLLGNARRLAVLSYLLETDGQATVKELSTHIAAEEHAIHRDEVTAEQHKRVYAALCQCHLPRLDECNVVAFDDPEKTVTLGETAKQIDSFMRQGHESSAAIIEFALAAAVASVVALGGLGVGPFATVPTIAWAVLIAGTLVTIGVRNIVKNVPVFH